MRLRVDDVATCAAAWLHERSALHADEARRAAQIAQPLRRAQFQAGRQLAAQMLAQHAGGLASQWVISTAPGEKPQVVSGPALVKPSLSIAHRGQQVCCAVSDDAVGVDVEVVGRLRDGVDAYRDFVLAPDEHADHALLPLEARTADLLARWALKEAWAKRSGRGLDLAEMPQLQARQATADANAWLWQHGDLVLALCADGFDAPPQPAGWPGASKPSAWRVIALPTFSARRAVVAAA